MTCLPGAPVAREHPVVLCPSCGDETKVGFLGVSAFDLPGTRVRRVAWCRSCCVEVEVQGVVVGEARRAS